MIKCSGLLLFSDAQGTSSSLVCMWWLSHGTVKTSLYWLYSMCSLSYSFDKYNTSILHLMSYHVLNYCVPPPLIEIHIKWQLGKRQWCILRAIVCQWCLACSSTPERKISDKNSSHLICWALAHILQFFSYVWRKRKRTKLRFSCLTFSTLRKVSRTLGVDNTIE